MAELSKENLALMGEGTFYQNQKLYIPKNIVDFLKLKQKDKVKFLIMLDPEFREYVFMRKK